MFCFAKKVFEGNTGHYVRLMTEQARSYAGTAALDFKDNGICRPLQTADRKKLIEFIDDAMPHFSEKNNSPANDRLQAGLSNHSSITSNKDHLTKSKNTSAPTKT